MSLNATRTRLMTLTKAMAHQWQDTRNYWKDDRSQEFGQKYMEQLLLHMDKAVVVCEKLDKLITKVRSDCE